MESASIRAHVHPWNPLSWSGSSAKLSECLAKEYPVYMFSHWHPFFSLSQYRIIKSLKKKRPDLKIAGIFHNVEPHERFPFQQQLTRKLINATDVPVVLSSQTESEFREFTRGRQPVKLFHPVYEQDYPSEQTHAIRKRLGLESDDFVLLFFGLVREYKGLDILIDALNSIPMHTHRIQLLVAGEFYVNAEVLMNRISAENKDRIRIINRFVSNQESAEFLSISDIMVLPYRTASQSGVMSDAIHFEMPVIVSNLPGLTEHIKQGKHGYIVTAGDSSALAEAIVEAANATDRQAMRSEMKELKKNLSWPRFSSELLNALQC
jgi:glycosyltransferase involved in cell wall biosynthesis